MLNSKKQLLPINKYTKDLLQDFHLSLIFKCYSYFQFFFNDAYCRNCRCIIVLNESPRSNKSWTFVPTLQNTPHIQYSIISVGIISVAGAKGQSYCVRWKVEAIEAAEVWPGMRLGSAPGAAPGLLVSSVLIQSLVTEHWVLLYKVICTEERLTIQIHKQEGTRTVAAGKIIKGHIKWVLQSQGRVSESGTDRVLWDCYNVCNANMRQLELMPVINICCHTTRSLHNTATTAHMRAADRHRRDV